MKANTIQTEWDTKQSALLLAARYLQKLSKRHQIEFGQESIEELAALITAIQDARTCEIQWLRSEIAQLEADLETLDSRVAQRELLYKRYGTAYPQSIRDWWLTAEKGRN